MRHINEEIFFNLTKPPFMSVYWAMSNFESFIVNEADIKKSKSKKSTTKKSSKIKINKIKTSPEKKKNAK